jgi:hypothetical protein
MRYVFRLIGVCAFGVAAATGLPGCGGSGAPPASSPSMSSIAPVDPDGAFAQFDEAVKPFECSPAYGAMIDAAQAGNFVVRKDKARQYRGVITTWDADLGEIAVPTEAQPIVAKVREFNATELAHLNELVGIDVKDVERIEALTHSVQVDDMSVVVEGNHLRDALGHPQAVGGAVADDLELAYRTFDKDTALARAQWQAALKAKDLNGAKAANKVEQEAAQRYIDQVGTIEWPPGFDHQVDALREGLREVIESDRRQVDVATAADIVEDPEDGVAAGRAAETAKKTLCDDLVSLWASSNPPSC